jgi:hypothetical protein
MLPSRASRQAGNFTVGDDSFDDSQSIRGLFVFLAMVPFWHRTSQTRVTPNLLS